MPWAKQTRWNKARFIEYTDTTFSVRKPQPDVWAFLANQFALSDTIVVEFLNRSRLAHSIHPHGLRYEKASEGAFYLTKSV